jgi:hypothetical protein
MYFASIELTRQSVVTEVVMGIDAEDFRMFVIRPTLQKLGVSGTAAELLLLGTAAAESSLGAFFKSEGQRTSGIYRMHGLTHRHIWDDYLASRPELASTVRGIASQHEFLSNPHAELTTNLSYATAVAWLAYVRHPEFTLPDAPTPRQLAQLWKHCYHPRDDLSVEDFVERFDSLIEPSNAAA